MSDPQKLMEALMTPCSTLSLKSSDSSDQSLTVFFENRLKKEYEYDDSTTERLLKEQVFQDLKAIIFDWLQETSVLYNESSSSPVQPSGEYKIFGSFRMEVNQKDSDLDTVCIVPRFVSRDDDFFGKLFTRLKSHEKVSEIYQISDAMVPLIKLKFREIPVDILFAKLEMDEIPKDLDFLHENDAVLQKIDEKSYKSLNGVRTAELIMRSVGNLQEFRVFLKLIKLWAKNNFIYSSVMGYLGGISYAILCAKICQLYPNYSVVNLIERFFFIYSLWIWDEMPVLLQSLCTSPDKCPNSKLLQFQWDEKAERTEMSIITPAFPCMNSSHTVSITTAQIIRKAFRKGYKRVRMVKNGLKSWDFLFEKVDFFEKFPLFLEISIVATINQGDFLIWKGHYESRLRKLIRIIESSKLHKLATFQLNPIPFEKKDPEFECCVCYFVGIKITEDNLNQAKLLKIKELDLDPVIKSFLDTVEIHQFIPDYLNTRIRLVEKENLDNIFLKPEKDKEKEVKEVKKILLKEKIPKI